MIPVEKWPQFAAMAKEVDDELADTRWANGTHGTAYLYNKGCHGPLCKRANRLRKPKGTREPLEYGYLEIREAEYLELKRAEKIAEYMKTRPPGTTRIDWIERAERIGRQQEEKAS